MLIYKRGDNMKMTIAETLIKLMKSTNYNQISVSMICNAVPVSRPTFYKYFHDKNNVVEWFIENDFQQNCYPIYKFHLKERGVQTYFSYLKNHKKFYIDLYNIDQGNFIQYCLQRAYISSIPNLREFSKKVDSYSYIVDTNVFSLYATSGIASVVVYWIKLGMNIPEEKIAKDLYFMMEKSLTEVRDYHLVK